MALGLVVTLALAFATLPVTAPIRDGTPTVLRPRDRSVFNLLSLAPVDRRTVAAAAVLGLVVSSTYSLATYRQRWADNAGRPYFANARADLDRADPTTVLYNGAVPSAVVWRLLWPATLPSRLLPPTGAEFDVLRQGESTPQLEDIGADGHLRRSTVSGIASVPGPDGRCGWRVDATGVTVRLDSAAFAWDWVVQLRYSTRSDGTLALAAGDTETAVPMSEGHGVAYVAVSGAVTKVRLAASGTDSVCVKGLVVGLPQPADW